MCNRYRAEFDPRFTVGVCSSVLRSKRPGIFIHLNIFGNRHEHILVILNWNFIVWQMGQCFHSSKHQILSCYWIWRFRNCSRTNFPDTTLPNAKSDFSSNPLSWSIMDFTFEVRSVRVHLWDQFLSALPFGHNWFSEWLFCFIDLRNEIRFDLDSSSLYQPQLADRCIIVVLLTWKQHNCHDCNGPI